MGSTMVRLQNTISVDLFYRLVELLEIDINTLPDHPAIQHMDDDDTVYVQNKIGVPDPVQVTPVKAAAKKCLRIVFLTVPLVCCSTCRTSF
eukprot:742775-Amphidinium_carterae.2